MQTATRSTCCWCNILCCALPKTCCTRKSRLDDVARVLQPVLAEADATPLEWCEPLEQILEKTKQCHSLRDMMEEGLSSRGGC